MAFVLHPLCMWAQPIVDLTMPERVFSYELLLRTVNSRGEIGSPADFLATLEQTGDTLILDQWVGDQTCQLLEGYWSLHQVQINVSSRTVADNPGRYLDALEQALRRSRVQPARITVEVTEHWHDLPPSTLRRFVAHLHALGCKSALDDFGAGISSLRALAAADVRQVKLDGDLVTMCASSVRARQVVSSALALVLALGAEVVAEHIPDQGTEQWLIAEGVLLGQSNRYGLPLPTPLCATAEPAAASTADSAAADPA